MRRLSVLMATVFIDMLGFAMIFPLLPFYALRLGAAPWTIGWMIASYAVAQIIMAPLWGRVSDRYGRRPAILVGLTASGLAFIVFALASEVWMLFLSRLIQGAGGGLAGVAQAYVGDTMEPSERVKSLGWLSAAASAGVMIGPGLGSLSTTLSSAAPGFLAAGLCFANAIFAWRWLEETSALSESRAASKPLQPLGSLIWQTLRAPRHAVSRLIWIYAFGMLSFMSMTAVLALYLRARFGITEKTIGIFFIYTGGAALCMRALALGRLVDWLGEVRVLRLGALCLVVGLAAIPLPASPLGLAAVLTLVPVGTACLFPAISALVSHLAPRPELGQTLGVQQAFGGVARVVAPLWATAVFQTQGPGAAFPLAAGIAVIASLMAFSLDETPLARERASDKSHETAPDSLEV